MVDKIHTVCPLCRVHVKLTDTNRFVQHRKYLSQQGIWVDNTICKKSGKKA